MADNEIRANIKIDIESNAKEAVSEIKKEFESLHRNLNTDDEINMIMPGGADLTDKFKSKYSEYGRHAQEWLRQHENDFNKRPNGYIPKEIRDLDEIDNIINSINVDKLETAEQEIERLKEELTGIPSMETIGIPDATVDKANELKGIISEIEATMPSMDTVDIPDNVVNTMSEIKDTFVGMDELEIPEELIAEVEDLQERFGDLRGLAQGFINMVHGLPSGIAHMDRLTIPDDTLSKVEDLKGQFSALDTIFDDLVEGIESGRFTIPDDMLSKVKELEAFNIDTSNITGAFELMNSDIVMFEEKIPAIIEELGLAQKPAQEIADSFEIASKYAMNISNMKLPDNATSWFGDDNNDAVSYDFEIPAVTSQQTEEAIEQTSKLKNLFSGLGESASGASTILGGELTGAFSKLLPTLGAGAVLLKGFKMAISETKEAMSDIIDISKSAGSTLVDAFNSILNIIDKLIDKIAQLSKKIKSLADQGVTLQQKWFTAYNYLGAQTGTEIRDFLGDIEQVYGLDGDQLVGSLRQISSLVSNVGLNAEDSSKAIKELMTRSIDISSYSGIDYDSIINNLQSAVSMGYIGRSSPLIRVLDLDKEDVENFRALNSEADRLNFILSKSEHVRGTYEKWLNTSAGRVDRLNNSISRLQSNTQRLAMVLWSKIAPVLIKLIDLVNELVSGLAKLLDIDLTSAEANLASTDYIFDGLSEDIGSVSDNLDKTADSADKAKKHLASFDDVIQINDDTSSKMDDELEGLGGSEGLSNVLGNFDFGALAGDIGEAKSELKEFFDLLKEGEYLGAGTWLGNYITDKLNSIDWDNIQNKAREIATNLALFLDGLFNNKELFKAIGKTIAEALNTAIKFIADFAANINWKAVGVALSQSWKSFWYNFDSADLGRALYNVIHGIFEAFWSFVADMWETDEYGADGWVLAGYRIADTINNFFSRWTMEDVKKAAQSIIDFIHGVFRMLAAFMKTLDTEDIKAKFQAFIHTLFTGFKEHAGEWGKTLGEFIDFIVDLLEILISEWDSTGMTGAVLDFLENSHISELLAEWMKIKFKIWWTKLLAEVLVGGEAILKCISDFGGKIGDLLKKIFIGIPLIVLGGAMQLGINLGNLLGEWGTNLGYWLYDLVQNIGAFFEYLGSMLWDGISSAEGGLEDFGGWIYDKVQWIKDTIVEKWNEFQELWGLGIDSIREGWSSFCDGVVGVWDSITGGIKDIFQGVVDFILGGIDKLCSGLTGLLDLLHEVPVVGSAMDGLSSFTGKIINKIDIPFLADGGIVSRATPAIVGEAGKEAVIPLENNTGWMDILANKTAQRLGGITQSNNQSVVIDMSKSVKPIYTRSEMLAFGKQVADALKIYGVQVSVVQ